MIKRHEKNKKKDITGCFEKKYIIYKCLSLIKKYMMTADGKDDLIDRRDDFILSLIEKRGAAKQKIPRGEKMKRFKCCY